MSRGLQAAAEASDPTAQSETTSFLMASAGGLRQDTAGCPYVRLRDLAARRTGERGAFARTVVTSREAPRAA